MPEAFIPAQDKSKDRQLLDNDDDIDALEDAEDDFADDPFLEAYRCAQQPLCMKMYITRMGQFLDKQQQTCLANIQRNKVKILQHRSFM